MNRTVFKSPIGKLLLAEENGKLCGVSFYRGETVAARESRLLLEAEMQLTEYFAGKRREFELPIHTDVSEFADSVLREVSNIPYGATATYSEIAASLGNPNASRAVGMACHNNPVAIIIPCHRVVGVGTNLVGYAGGITAKEYLLRLEGGIF